MSSEKSLTPQIRFKGFTEAWEQCKLGDIAAFSKGQGFSKSNLTDSGSPVILYGRLYTNYETQICKVDTFVKSSSCGVLSKGGEVIVPASGETAEDIAVASHVSLPGILLGGDLNVVTPKDNLDSNFLALFITFGNAHVELSKRAQGKSVVHVRNGDLSQLNIKYPTQSEQILISNLFIKNDNLITLHQRKLDALKKIKSALLEKMFPKDGSDIPEIRFTGFTEAWEQRKAIDLFKDVSEKGFDNLPVLSATQDRGMVYRDENGINISHDKKNELTYKHVIPGQFVIHLRSFQGGFAHSAIEGITSPAYTVFKFSNESQHDDIFWKYIFMSERFIKSLETVTYGIRDGRSISYSEFLGLPFAVPEKEEENRIGHFLKKYDSLITLHQRKLDALKKIKSALLEKMFV